jgi:hypothetical protein
VAYRHPHPLVLAKHLEDTAKLLRQNPKVFERARVYSERGFPGGTIGEGSRSSDPTSVTEREALYGSTVFDELPEQLAARAHFSWKVTLKLAEAIEMVSSHAGDQDRPARSGCDVCERICRTDKNPRDRLVSGYCPACYMQWTRKGKPDREYFKRTRRQYLGLERIAS